MNEELYEIDEGTDPYLFISYSHQDSEQVEPLIHGLHDMGYRLWYDTGIAVGSRWPDTIAEHLMESNCVVAFISENAVASDYCQEELFFAMELRKPIVAVYLADTMLPPGLRMRLSARQAIFRYRFNDDESFLRKLDREPVVKACKQTEALVINNNISIPKYADISSNSNVPSSLYSNIKSSRPPAFLGAAEVKSTYKHNKLGTIGMCMVYQGTIKRDTIGRVLRNGSTIFEGKIHYLSYNKISVSSVASSNDCAIHIEGFDDIQVGDFIHCIQTT